MNKVVKFMIPTILPALLFLMLSIPSLSLAAGLVPCNNNSVAVTNPDGTPVPPTPCDFDALMALVNKVINFLLFDLSIPVAACMFCYAGFLLIIPGGESAHSRTTAKGIAWHTSAGLAWASVGWLVVSSLLTALGYQGTWIGLHIGAA